MNDLTPRHAKMAHVQTLHGDRNASLTLPQVGQVMWRRKLLIVGMVLITALCGFLYSVLRGERYTAEAQLQIQPGSAAGLKQSMSSVINAAADMDVTIESYGRVLRSDTLLLAVAKKLKLQENPDFVAKNAVVKRSLWAGPSVSLFRGDLNNPYVRNAVLKLLKLRLKVERVPRTEMLTVSYSSKSPALAVSIVNTLLSEFIEHNFSAHFAARGHVVNWLGGQMDDLRARVQRSQDKMVALERKLGLMSLDPQHTLLIAEVANLEKNAADATEQRVVSEARYKILSTMPPDQIVDSATGLGSDFPNNSLGSLRSQRATVASELAKLNPVYGPNYPSVRQAKAQLSSLDGSIEAQQNRVLQQAKEAYELAQKEEGKARGLLDSKTGEIYSRRDDLVQYQLVSQEFASDRHMYESILQRLQEASVDAGLDAADIEVVDLAAIPVEPSSVSPFSLAAVGGAFGFLGALTLALFSERLDTSLRDAHQVQELTGLPALATIPRFKRPKAGRRSGVTFQRHSSELLQAPQSQFAESFRALRTSMRFAHSVPSSQVIMVTSCQAQEGKTTVSVNMATALAQTGRRVLLVDADMRRPTIHKRMQLPAEGGLSDVLVGYAKWGQVTYADSHLPSLHVLPSGAIPPLPSELLAGERMAQMIAEVRDEYDYVIVDTPPLLSVTDGAIVASQADSLVLTVREGRCNRKMLNRAGSIVQSVNANTLGFVFNKADSAAEDYYGYSSYEDQAA